MNNYQPPFDINNEILVLVSKISEIIGNISHYENLEKFPRLRRQNRIRSIQSSCAIEANTLSFDQVCSLINGKRVVGPEKDIIEINNAIKAYDNMSKANPCSINDLLKTHKILMNKIVADAGSFRRKEEGVFDGDKCIFIAPPAKYVNELMNSLFMWMKDSKTKINPLILSCVFHYEFVFIHPFSDGNGRMARLWQNVILGKYRSLFFYLPIENYIKDNQKEYYDAIKNCHKNGSSTEFIIFMLNVIYKALINAQNDLNNHANHMDKYVNKLLNVMESGIPLTTIELMNRLNLKSKKSFREHYLYPAIDSGLVEFELKDKKTSKNQRYIKI